MSLSLYVDGDRWRGHLRATLDAEPALVPVCKGNGYGLGLARLARKAGWLGVDTLAVGTYDEVDEVSGRYDGAVMVLTPWRPFEQRVVYDPRVVHTVGRLEDLEDLCTRADRPRVVLERLTSMLRHGFSAPDLRAASRTVAAHPGGVRVEGVALHLPMNRGSHLTEVERLMTDVVAADLPTRRVFVSHLTPEELAVLRASYPDFTFRPRAGTALWLGERTALRARAAVLEVHRVQRGDVFGYRGRHVPRAGSILVVSGGTAHGIGLEAPTGAASARQRAVALAKGGLEAAGFARSPFTIGGRQRLFAEPPHMQASMLYLPQDAVAPEVGSEVDVRVRFTSTTFDRTVIS